MKSPMPYHMKIAALLPPSNIERIITGLQEAIYSASGAVSAVALPVMIPLRLLSDAVTPDSFQKSLGDTRAGFPICSHTYRKVEASMFLGLKAESPHEPAHRRIIQNLASFEPYESRTPFPPFFGFYLCDFSGIQAIKPDLSDISQAPSFRFSSFHFALIDLFLASDQDNPWHHVEWKVLVSWKSLRPRRK